MSESTATQGGSTSPNDGKHPVLEAQNVAVHYGGIKAVDSISFQLWPGQIFGILGPNGSGKTTLLGAMTRLVDLTRGSLLLDGEAYETSRPASLARRGVARTFQTVRLLPGLTVRENIMLGGDLRQRVGRKSNSDGAVAEVMERTGLRGMERLRPGELSYGFQRRVEIARAIAMRPNLLLLDEPTAGMNQTERQEISALLKRLRSEGLTQLLVEHDVQMMVETCDYLFAMNFGSLIAQGAPATVVADPGVREAYLGKKWSQSA